VKKSHAFLFQLATFDPIDDSVEQAEINLVQYRETFCCGAFKVGIATHDWVKRCSSLVLRCRSFCSSHSFYQLGFLLLSTKEKVAM
jgi:hypothetical protein